jgi:predicted HicB family RNase H-like nuclease
LGPTLHQQVSAAAATDGVSLNSWIVRALEERTSG